jgi:hypothetical protein
MDCKQQINALRHLHHPVYAVNFLDRRPRYSVDGFYQGFVQVVYRLKIGGRDGRTDGRRLGGGRANAR